MLCCKKKGRALSVLGNREHVLQFTRYGIVGLITAIIYLVIGYLLSKRTSLGAISSANIAFVVAIAVNYSFHFLFTFQKKSEHIHSAPRFAATISVGFILNSLVVWLSTSVFQLAQSVAQVVAMLIVIGSNYVLFTLWVFGNPPEK